MKKFVILILLVGCSTTTNVTEQPGDASVTENKTIDVLDVPVPGSDPVQDAKTPDPGPVGGQEGGEPESDASTPPEPEAGSGPPEPQDAGPEPEAGSGGTGGVGGMAGTGGSGGSGGIAGTGGVGGSSGSGGADGPCMGIEDGEDCTNDGFLGRCRGGDCCTGCWDGTTCHFQTDDPDSPPWSYELNFCGNTGVPCKDCDTGNPCKVDECSFGINCKSTDVTDYTDCPTGQCYDGACEAVGGLDQPCENGTTCGSGLVCDDDYCWACGEEDELCCAGNSCNGSLECKNGVCKPEVICGSKGQPCCAGSTCNSTVHLECVSGTCECGSLGQVCCRHPVTFDLYCDVAFICREIPGTFGGECRF